VKGVVPHLIEDGLSILQNAYNTFTFLSWHWTCKLKNMMKPLLCV
jgi:hypothetical protein